MADCASNGTKDAPAGDRSSAAGNGSGRRGRGQNFMKTANNVTSLATAGGVSAVGVGDVLRVADSGKVQAVGRQALCTGSTDRLHPAAGGPAGRARC